jgi:hypothetical protein
VSQLRNGAGLSSCRSGACDRSRTDFSLSRVRKDGAHTQTKASPQRRMLGSPGYLPPPNRMPRSRSDVFRSTSSVVDEMRRSTWGYADFFDNVVEDILFRAGSPYTRDAWPTPSDRAHYAMNKERKFGSGCIDQWERDRASLLARARHLLSPTLSTLRRQPFLFGAGPTLADAAMHGPMLRLEAAQARLPARYGTPCRALPALLRPA